MPLIREFDALVRGTFRLWWRFLPQMLTWLALGWVAYSGALIGSAALGQGVASMVVFALGIAASVVAQIFAIHSLKPGLTSANAVDHTGVAASTVPGTVFRHERRVDVAILTIGPVLGVYAVWEMLDEMIRDGFFWNALIRTVGDTANWSVSFRPDLLPGYLGVGVVALLLRLGYSRFVKSRSSLVRIPLLVFEGLWVFATFFIVIMVLREAQEWLTQRRFWRAGVNHWHAFLDWLPDLRLPFDLTLPQFLARFGDWFVEDFWPGVWQGLALPLVWLAVVAMVMGWREFRVRDLLQLRRGAAPREEAGRPTGFEKALEVATADLRDKYVPLIHALRLVWSSGPFVLGAYLIAYAVLQVVEVDGRHLLYRLFAAGDQSAMFRAINGVDAAADLLFGSLMTCLLVSAFDRGVTDTLRQAARKQASSAPSTPVAHATSTTQ